MQDLSPNNRFSLTPPPFTASEESDNPGFSLQSIKNIVIRRWIVITIASVAVFAFQLTSDFRRPPVYQEKFDLLVQPPEQGLPNPLAGTAGARGSTNYSGRDYYATQVTFLLSNKLLNPVLKTIYQKYPELNETNFGYKTFVQRINITKPEEGEIITITYGDLNRDRVKFVLEQLAKAYLEFTIDYQSDASEQRLKFVTEQLPLIRKRVAELQEESIRLQQAYNFFSADSEGETISALLNSILQKKQEISVQILQSQETINGLKQQLGITENQAIVLNSLSQSPQYLQLLGRLNEINLQLAKESTQLTDENIVIQQLKAERNNLLPLIRKEASAILSTVPQQDSSSQQLSLAPNDIRSATLKQILDTNIQLIALKTQQQELIDAEIKARADLQSFTMVAGKFREINRELGLATESLNRLAEAEQSLKIESSKSFTPWQLVSDITLPSQPIDTLPKDILLALLKGLLAGGVAGFIAEKLDSTYHDPEEIARQTGKTILGTVPWDPKLATLIAQKTKATNIRFIDAFSTIYSNLFFLGQKQTCRSFVITSAASGDGKSTSSFFLALAAARLGQRVLLIDGDRYFPQGDNWKALAEVFDATVDSNSSELVAIATSDHSKNGNEKEIQDSKLESLGKNLFYFKTQDNAMEPSQLMSSQGFFIQLQEWQKTFDVILIDTPPVLGVTDARLLAKQTDGVLLVTRLGKTTRDSIRLAINELKLADLNLLGIVANGANSQTTYDYYYYNRYYRKRQEQNKPKSAV